MPLGQSQKKSPSRSSTIHQDILIFIDSSKSSSMGTALLAILSLALSFKDFSKESTFPSSNSSDSKTMYLFLVLIFIDLYCLLLFFIYHWYPLVFKESDNLSPSNIDNLELSRSLSYFQTTHGQALRGLEPIHQYLNGA